MSTPIGNIQRLVPGLIEQPGGQKQSLETPVVDGNSSFGKMLGQFVDSVNDMHAQAADAQEAMMAGEPVELHQVMIKGEMAGLATDLLLQVRNRLVDGFNDIMRMPM